MTGQDAKSIVAGSASGTVLKLAGALSFWGGVDPVTGRIIDHTSDRHGELLAGRILVMPGGRGSSSAAAVLAETIRNGTGPAAIVMARGDGIIAAGAIIARSLYGIDCPVVVVETIEGLDEGMNVEIDAEAGSARLRTG